MNGRPLARQAAAVSDLHPGAPEAASTGKRLELSADGQRHTLDGDDVADTEILEVLTDGGWVSGHYRTWVHPDSGLPAFELHLGFADAGHPSDDLSHAVIFLPPQAILRRPRGSDR